VSILVAPYQGFFFSLFFNNNFVVSKFGVFFPIFSMKFSSLLFKTKIFNFFQFFLYSQCENWTKKQEIAAAPYSSMMQGFSFSFSQFSGVATLAIMHKRN
jgi:hypothetical protein